MGNEPIRTEVDGITFLSTELYYEGINQWVAHKLKEGNIEGFDYAAAKWRMAFYNHLTVDWMSIRQGQNLLKRLIQWR